MILKRMFAGFLLTSAFLSGCNQQKSLPQPEVKTPIRIGWQTGWATQGQLAQTLKHTDILGRHGLVAQFKGFSYGGPLNEAALANQVDVIFTADQPAATLIARGGQWKIVARLIDFRAGLVVPPDSPAKATADLRGKTVAIPFGSTTHRIALSMLKAGGLAVDTDVQIRNLDILEQSALAQSSSHGSWGEIAAMASWDPTVALLESKKLARVLEQRPAIAVVLMSDNFLKRNPEAAVRFLKSYRLAYAYYAKHPLEANKWFIEETKTQLPPGVLDVAAAFERNMKVKTVADVQIGLSEAEIAAIQEGADFGLAQKLTTRSPNMREAIDQSFLNRAVTTPELMKLDEVKAR
jgi:sulfonate transport system substrate-binding protein